MELVTTTQEILEPGQRTLEELAADITEGHSKVVGGLSVALTAAIQAGDDLLEAQSRLEHGEWQPWIEKLQIGNVAYTYMRLAEFKTYLPAEFTSPVIRRVASGNYESTATITKALAYLKSLGVSGVTPSPRKHDHQEIRRLKDKGLGQREIARLLEISQSSVYYALLPTGEKKRLTKLRRQKYQETQTALRRHRQQQAVRAASNDLAEAYSLVRKCLQRTQVVHDSLPTGMNRRLMQGAMSALHQAEDRIAKVAKETT